MSASMGLFIYFGFVFICDSFMIILSFKFMLYKISICTLNFVVFYIKKMKLSVSSDFLYLAVFVVLSLISTLLCDNISVLFVCFSSDVSVDFGC